MQNMTLRQILTFGIGLAIVGVAGGSIYFASSLFGEPTAENNSEARPIPVATVPIHKQNQYQVNRIYTGQIRAAKTSELTFELSGRLINIHFEEGDQVSKGEELAEIDVDDLKARKDELTAQLAAERAYLEELIEGPRLEKIDAAKAQVKNFTAELKLKEADLARARETIKSGAITPATFDKYLFTTEATQAQLENAKAILAELVAGSRKEKVIAQRAKVKQIEASISEISIQIERSIIYAPYDGIISKRYADEGTIISPGAPLFRIVQINNLEAWIGLPVNASFALNKQSAFDLTVQGVQHTATVKSVLPELDPATRTRMVIFQMTDKDSVSSETQKVFPAQLVRINLAETKSESGYWIPKSAIVQGTRSLRAIYVLNPAENLSGLFEVKKHHVKILHLESDRVFVEANIPETSQLVRDGTHRISPGQIVSLQSAADTQISSNQF